MRDVRKIKMMAISLMVKESGGSSKLLSTCFSRCRMTNERWKIPNACGSIGLLHSLLNLPERGPDALNPDSKLAQFKAESLPLSGTLFCHLLFLRVGRYWHICTYTGLERAKLLDETTFFTVAHTNAAQTGQSVVPTDLDVDEHFIAFVEGVDEKGWECSAS